MTKRLGTPQGPRIDSLAKVASLAPLAERADTIQIKRELVESLAREQKRFAQMLHDTLAQSLTAARIHARLAKKKLSGAADTPSGLEELERVVETAVNELQWLMLWHRAADFDSYELVPALECLADLTSGRVPTQFDPPGVEFDADRAVELQMVRVAQVTLLDILARRTAQSATLSLCCEADELVLCIDECGSEPSPVSWASLLKAEIAAIGGTFAVVEAKPMRAGPAITRVVCRLPKRL